MAKQSDTPVAPNQPNADIAEVLRVAQQKYGTYIELARIASAVQEAEIVTSRPYSWSHPLTLVIRS